MLGVILVCAKSVVFSVAAWITALLFMRTKRKNLTFLSLSAATLTSAINSVLAYFNVEFDTAIVCFLVLSVLAQLQEKRYFGNAILTFFIAAGMYCLFSYVGNSLEVVVGGWFCYVFSAILPLVMTLTAFSLRNSFPTEDWRDYFSNSNSEEKAIIVTKAHIYIVLGVMFCTELLFLLISVPQNIWQLICLALVASAVLLVSLYSVSVMTAYKRERIATAIEKQYRDEMQTFMNIIRSQRHDYNFHLQALSGIINRGSIDECKKYLDSLVKDTIDMNAILPVKDPAIAALINSFRLLAAQRGLQLQVNIEFDPSGIATNLYETNKILGNLLQNAIDETEKHTDKSYGVKLHIIKRGEFCVIRVENKLVCEAESIEVYLSNIFKHGYTTKYGHEGIGLSGVKHIVEKHKGVLYARMEGDIINFVAKVPIVYKEREDD